MYFKIMSVFFSLLIAGTLLNCAGEDEPYLPKLEIKIPGEKKDCLEDFSITIDKYVLGQLSVEQVEEFWTCTSTSVDTFIKYVNGSEKDIYNAKELRQFFHKYFLGDTKISDELLEEAMTIKRLFLGGNSKQVTRGELFRTKDLVLKLRKMSLRLQPHIKILSLNNKTADGRLLAPEETQFNQATNSLEVVFEQLGSLIAWNEIEYSFSNLNRFLTEMYKLSEDRESRSKAEFVPVLAKAKVLIMGSSDEYVSSHEWAGLLEAGSKVYREWLRFSYYIDHDQWSEDRGSEHIYKVTQSAASLLKGFMIERRLGVLPDDEVNDLIIEVAKLGKLPFNLSPDDAIATWSVLVNKLLISIGPRGGKLSSSTGLTFKKLDLLLEEVSRWFEVQSYVNNMPQQAVGSDATREMDRVLDGPWALRTDASDRVIIDLNKGEKPNQSSLTLLNMGRALVRLVVRAYSEDAGRRWRLTGLTTEELQSAYLDLRPLLAGIGLVERDDDEFYLRIFREANVFLPRSNGDQYVSFEEGLEYFFYVMGGISAGDFIIDDMANSCEIREDKENDTRSVEIHCFRQKLRENFSNYAAHLPGLVSTAEKFNDKQWASFISDLELTVRSKADPKTPIASGDIKEMQILLKYVETILRRWDLDQSDSITLEEGLEIFPVFKKTLGDLFLTDDEDVLLVFFTYMLRYGKAPDPSSALDGLRHLNWRLNRDKWEFSTLRPQFNRILSSLAAL